MAERSATISIQLTSDATKFREEFAKLREEIAQNPFEVGVRMANSGKPSTFGGSETGAAFVGTPVQAQQQAQSTTLSNAQIRQQAKQIQYALGGANADVSLGGYGRQPGIAPNSVWSGDMTRALGKNQAAIVNLPAGTDTVVAARAQGIATGKPDQSYGRSPFRERLDYLDRLGGYRSPSEEVSYQRLRVREAELRMNDPARTSRQREQAIDDRASRLAELDKAVSDNAAWEVWKRENRGSKEPSPPLVPASAPPVNTAVAPMGFRARAAQVLINAGMPSLGAVAGGMSLGQALPLVAGAYLLDGGVRGQVSYAAGGASAGADLFAQARNEQQYGGGIEAQLIRQLPVISGIADYLSGASVTIARRQREVDDQRRVEGFRVSQQGQTLSLGFAGQSAAASISGSFDSAATAARIGFTQRENERRARVQERNQSISDKYAAQRNDFDVQNTSGSIYDAYIAQPLYGALGYATNSDARMANAQRLQQQSRAEISSFSASDAAERAASERLRNEETRAARIQLRNEMIGAAASIRSSELTGQNQQFAAQVVELQGQRQIASEAAGRAQSPEQQAAARQQVERVDAAIRSLQNAAVRQAQISVLQGDAGLNRAEGAISGFRRDRAILAANQEAQAAMLAIDPSAPGAASLMRQVQQRREQQVRVAEFDSQRSEIAAQTTVRASQFRMSGGTLESQLTSIRGQFAANTVGLAQNSPEFRRASEVAQQQEAEARFNSRFAMTQIGIGLRGEALATNALLGRNYAGAEAYGIAASGAARVRDLLMGPGSASDNRAAAELARQNSLGQLGVARQEYLLGFRAQQFNPFEMVPFNPRDRQNPEEVLGAFRAAEKQIRDAEIEAGGGMSNINPDSMRQFAQVVKDGLAEAITSRIANN